MNGYTSDGCGGRVNAYFLLDEEGLSWEDAWDITTHCVSYTNHH